MRGFFLKKKKIYKEGIFNLDDWTLDDSSSEKDKYIEVTFLYYS